MPPSQWQVRFDARGQETTECHFSIHLPINQINLRAMAFTIAALAVVAIVALWFTFRYYPEKRAAERFLDALVAGDAAKALYTLEAGPSYSMKDFLADWGPDGY